MKVLLVVFALIGFTYATVADGFERISLRMPKEAMKGAVEIYNDGDSESQSFVQEVQGDQFRSYINEIM